MAFPATVEQQAGNIRDGVAKLRFLRLAEERRRRRARTAARLTKLGSLFLVLLAGRQIARTRDFAAPASAPPLSVRPPVARPSAPDRIWLVESSDRQSLYSNGLTVRNELTVASVPRRYSIRHKSGAGAEPGDQPAGIVFHTTESQIVPLEQESNTALRRSRESVLAQVRRERLYNFLIDRFGQIYRIVPEEQRAFHAGHSVWANEDAIYLDLNESFVGVAFEAQTGEENTATPAQVNAARLLVTMLRSRFSIPDANCVTHAQVSVNPDNLRLGYHTDWASHFPFQQVGLETGYGATVAGVSEFGFVFDETFLHAIGGHAWDGLTTAEEKILHEAARRGMTPQALRGQLQQKYRQLRRHASETTG